MSEDERHWTRIKQRIWLSLFVANTMCVALHPAFGRSPPLTFNCLLIVLPYSVLSSWNPRADTDVALQMQFDMNVLIGPDDPAISASSRFAMGSPQPLDTLLVASVQLRRLYHIYSDMAKSLETYGESQFDKAAKLVSLSLLTRTANRELEQALRDWKDECKSGKSASSARAGDSSRGGTERPDISPSTVGLVRIDSKLDIWVAAIKLKVRLLRVIHRTDAEPFCICSST